ncbi:MAG: hypothetical protein AAF141_07895 [Pseudomonadota bacterium]
MNALNRLPSTFLSAAIAGFALVAYSTAHAEDSSLKPAPESVTSQSFASCSSAFHADLSRIHFTLAEPLREAVVAGRTRDKAQPRNLTLPVPRAKRSKPLAQAINYASRSARSQGSDSWLRSDGGRWLTDSISTGLERYTGQDDSPFLCTGMEGYLGYLQPHQKKLTRINDTRKEHMDVALAAMDPAFEAAWLAMRPIPLPNFRPETPLADEPATAVSPLGDEALRTGTVEGQPVQDLDETTTGTVTEPLDDPDLPLLTEPEGRFEIAALSDVAGVIRKLHERLMETGHLAADAPSPLAGTGFDPVSIIENARSWVIGKAPAIANPLVRARVLAALSSYEVAAVIDANAYALRTVEDRMAGTFSAIRSSHAKHCTCR